MTLHDHGASKRLRLFLQWELGISELRSFMIRRNYPAIYFFFRLQTQTALWRVRSLSAFTRCLCTCLLRGAIISSKVHRHFRETLAFSGMGNYRMVGGMAWVQWFVRYYTMCGHISESLEMYIEQSCKDFRGKNSDLISPRQLFSLFPICIYCCRWCFIHKIGGSDPSAPAVHRRCLLE